MSLPNIIHPTPILGELPSFNRILAEIWPSYVSEVNRILVSDLAYDGFERLIRRNVSGLAVVNDDGHTLYGNFSASNIKNLGHFPPTHL